MSLTHLNVTGERIEERLIDPAIHEDGFAASFFRKGSTRTVPMLPDDYARKSRTRLITSFVASALYEGMLLSVKRCSLPSYKKSSA